MKQFLSFAIACAFVLASCNNAQVQQAYDNAQVELASDTSQEAVFTKYMNFVFATPETEWVIADKNSGMYVDSTATDYGYLVTETTFQELVLRTNNPQRPVVYLYWDASMDFDILYEGRMRYLFKHRVGEEPFATPNKGLSYGS